MGIKALEIKQKENLPLKILMDIKNGVIFA
jgi:hypothetical protein